MKTSNEKTGRFEFLKRLNWIPEGLLVLTWSSTDCAFLGDGWWGYYYSKTDDTS